MDCNPILEPLEQADWPPGFPALFGPDPGFGLPEALVTNPLELDS